MANKERYLVRIFGGIYAFICQTKRKVNITKS